MCNKYRGGDCETSMFITLSLVLLLLLCVIIFYYYQYRPAAISQSRFEHFKELYNKCLSGSLKDLKFAKVVTKADEVLLFGKLFNRPHPPMRPMFKTVFHDNNYEDWLCSRKIFVRNILAPNVVKSLEPIMRLCATEVLGAKSPAGVVEVVQLSRNYVNKVMYRCVFGGDRHEEEEFSYWSTKLRHQESEALKGTDQQVDGAEDSAAEEYFKKLIWSPDGDEESFLYKLKAFSPIDDVESNSVSFVLGGFTACVSALVFVMYELAACPDLQEDLRATPVPNKLFTLVVKEGLRKYPPFAAVIKTEDVNVSDAKPTQWILPVSGIHHDSQFYQEPSKFLPNREYPKNMFCSFGVGIRKCPGEHFSYSVVEVLLKHIVKHFKISRLTCDRARGELGFSNGKFTTTVDSLELLFEGI